MAVNKNSNDFLQLIDDDVNNIKITGDQSNNGVKAKYSDCISVIVDDDDIIQHIDSNSQGTCNKNDYLQAIEDDYLQVVDDDCCNATITDSNLNKNSCGVTGNENYCQMVDDYNSRQFTGNSCDQNNYESLKTRKQASLVVMHCIYGL